MGNSRDGGDMQTTEAGRIDADKLAGQTNNLWGANLRLIKERDAQSAELDRLRADLAANVAAKAVLMVRVEEARVREAEARVVCQIIDDVVEYGHAKPSHMIMHFLTALEPARAWLAGGAL